MLFAPLSFFWAAGGRTGLHPLELEGVTRDSVWTVFDLGAGILKVVIGLVALVQPWSQIFPRNLLRASALALEVSRACHTETRS